MRAEDGRLVATMGARVTGEVEHWHLDVFRVRWADAFIGDTFLVYTIDARGRPQWMRVGGTLLTRAAAPTGAAVGAAAR